METKTQVTKSKGIKASKVKAGAKLKPSIHTLQSSGGKLNTVLAGSFKKYWNK